MSPDGEDRRPMNRNGHGTGSGSPRWILVIQPAQRELFDLLQERLKGTDVQVILDRRERERRRGSLGPTMERRNTDRRRQRPVGMVAQASPSPARATAPAAERFAPQAGTARDEAFTTQRCPTCAVVLELEMPRFPHPPARVDLEIGHVAANGHGQDGSNHYVEIAAFTISGRVILNQRLPARIQR
jgi:hypothetical protein